MIKTTSLILVTFLTALSLVTNGICQDEIPTIKLSRKTAIAMAIRNNIDLRVRALDSSLAEADVQGSKSIYNPYLSASIDYGRTSVAGQTYGTETTSGNIGITQKIPTGGTLTLATRTGPTSAISDPLYDYTDWSSSIGITIYQPLLKNAGKQATELGIAQNKFSYDSSLEAFRDDVIDTVFSIVSDYNRLYVQHQLLESRKAAVRSAQQLLEEIKTKPNPGDNPGIELSNTEYALSQRLTEQIEAERRVRSQEADLRYLIGMEQIVHIIPVDPPSRQEPQETENDAIALALEQRPDLKRLRIELQSNELREDVSRRNLWPDLALTGSGGYRAYTQDGGFSDNFEQISEGKGKYWSAGMRVSFPIGNDLAESEYRRNRLRSEQMRNQITAEEWKIRDTIQDDNRSLISARLQVRATAKSKQLAEQRVAQYQKNRRLGNASVKDLLDAENDLIYARNLELNAIENFAYRVAELWKDIGVLLERQNVHIDTTRPDELTAGDYPVELPGDSPDTPEVDIAAAAAAVPLATPEGTSITETTEPKPPTTPADAAVQVSQEPSRPASQTTDEDKIAAAGNYTLKIGVFIPSELPGVKKKIERAGLAPVVMDGPKQERDVIRLLIGEFTTLQEARQALEPLKNTHSGGFILKQSTDRYDAYAGSFFNLEDAETEKQRLAPTKLELSFKKVTVTLPTFLLTAGSFSSRQAAIDSADKLEQQGLTSEVLHNKE